MSANPIWIAGYFGPVAGAVPVWIAPGDGTVPSAVQSEIVSYYAPVAGATAVWVAGFFAPPPAAIGATPITISGWGGSGGGGPPPVTSVWSAADAAANGMTLSNGGLTFASGSLAKSPNTSIRGTVSHTTGKVYIEFLANVTGTNVTFGQASAGFDATTSLGLSNYSCSVDYNANRVSSGFTSNYVTSVYPSTGDVIALAIDFSTGNLWHALNNVWTNGSNPATGSLPIISFVPATVGALFPGITPKDVTETWTLQATAASQKYLPPPGFQAWDGGPVTPAASSVWSAADAAANGMTLSNGGLTVTAPANTWMTARTSVAKTSGKLYVEFANSASVVNGNLMFGLASNEFVPTSYLGTSNYSGGSALTSGGNYVSSGFVSNIGISSPVDTVAGDVYSVAVDFVDGSFWLAKNNVWYGGGSPAFSKSLPLISFTPAAVGALFAAMSWGTSGNGIWTLQSTAASQKYAPPSGFKAWDAP